MLWLYEILMNCCCILLLVKNTRQYIVLDFELNQFSITLSNFIAESVLPYAHIRHAVTDLASKNVRG